MKRLKSFSNDSEDLSLSEGESSTLDTDDVRPHRNIWWRVRSALGFLPIHKDGVQVLLDAIRSNDEDEVSRILEGGINLADSPEIPWLCIAARRQNRRVLEMLLSYGAAVNATDEKTVSVKKSNSGSVQRISSTIKSRTALHEACKRGWVKGVKVLMEAHADVDKEDAKGETPLEMAIRKQHTEVVRLLLEGGARLTGQDNTMLPYLHIAPNPEITQLLLSVGAKINGTDRQGLAPLHTQVWTGRLEVVKELLKNGADPNVRGPYHRTPAFFLAVGEVKEILDELIKAGLDLTIIDSKGNNACHAIAFLASDDAVIEYVFDLEPFNWGVENHKGETPLHILEETGQSKLAARLKSKLERIE